MRQWAMVYSLHAEIRFWARVAGLGVVLCVLAAAQANASDNQILVADGPSMLGSEIGATLQQSLAPDYQFNIEMTDSDQDVFQRVLAAPGNIGVGHADVFLEFVRHEAGKAGQLEFHGAVPACMVLAVSQMSAVQNFDDLISRLQTDSAQGKTTIDVGPAQAGAAATFTALQRIVPELGNTKTVHSGGFRALSRVATGQIDAAAVMVYAPFSDERVNTLLQSDKIRLIPLYSHALSSVFNDPKSSYRARDIVLGGSKWFAASAKALTICTSLGVVANTARDGKLSEALARITLSGALEAPAPSIKRVVKDAATTGFTKTRDWIEGTVSGAFNAGRAWVEQEAATEDPPMTAKPLSMQGTEPSGDGTNTMPQTAQ
jgi:hypothetical protein